jgi:ribosomal protein L30E
MEQTTSSLMMRTFKHQKKNVTEEDLNQLKKMTFYEKVAVGFKETLRAIKSQETKQVFLAEHPDYQTQIEIIEEYASMNQLDQIQILRVPDWIVLRDIVMECLPSELEIEEAERLGREAKLNPKCFCVALLDEKPRENEENN